MTSNNEEVFSTRAAYQKAIDAVLALASKEICIFDSNMKAVEFDSRARADAIADFLSERGRNLRVILHDPDHLNRYSPRLTGLLKRYSHCFQVRQTPEALRGITDCFVLTDGETGVMRFHADHFRGKVLFARPFDIRGWRQRFEDLWGESTPCAVPTQLGL